ncbi:hypothetical protein [Amycolatopsis sp. NPDC102389]|uniref:hypothetical protein n=1 Tax=Amycolatopsis sp. NPDC102389 TaxID=3363941 RepID=UPI0038100299
MNAVAVTSEHVLWVGGAVFGGLVTRLLALLIALRGTKPGERPAIIRALGDLFRVLPRRRRP